MRKTKYNNILLASVYILIVVIISNIFWYVGYLNEESALSMFMLMLAQFFPMIVCLIMTKITGEGWNNLGITIKKKSWKYFGISIVATICLSYLSDPVVLLVFGKNVESSFTISSLWEIAMMTLLGTACFIECLGEELGWIGYLYGKLEHEMGIWKACTILGLLRGIYHIGILLHMDYPVQGFIELTVTNICLSFFMVYLYKKSESIFACSISHGISAMLPVFLVYNEDWYYTNPFAMMLANISFFLVGGYCFMKCKRTFGEDKKYIKE